MSSRPFRTNASFDFEKIARNRIKPFLTMHGFQVEQDERAVTGNATSQVIVSVDPHGVLRKMRIRLCWRRDGRNPRENLYSAAQLRARLIDGDWERTVANVAARGASDGIDQTLFVQADTDAILFAVIVPNSELLAIWAEQRRMSSQLIESGLMGRIRKNHAENGSSPTIWLLDERTPAAHRVSDIIWSWPGVVDVRSFPTISPDTGDDALDDLPLQTDVGRDGSTPVGRIASGWKRDPKVRALVLERANSQCEQSACGERREFPGFLDVHHILGVRASDRIWTCVALCPNCHRDAHFSPERDAINEHLLKFAEQFRARR